MRMRSGFLSIALALFVFGSAQSSKTQADRLLTAPTYYVAARTRGCTQQEMKVVGATNVPPGAVILVNVAEFFQDGWKDFSADYYATVDEKGFFEANVRALANSSFHPNLVARVVFGPAYHQQPAGVLTMVGRRGERLGSNNNPQLGQLSGDNFYIETIARVEGCPSEGR